jgi:hypothetical protein
MNPASWAVAGRTAAENSPPFVQLQTVTGKVRMLVQFTHPDAAAVDAAGVKLRNDAAEGAERELTASDSWRRLRQIQSEIAKATAEAEALERRRDELQAKRLALLADVDRPPDPKAVQDLEFELVEAGERARVYRDRAEALRKALPDAESFARNAARTLAERAFDAGRQKLEAERRAAVERLVKKAGAELSELARLEAGLLAFAPGAAQVLHDALERLVRS